MSPFAVDQATADRWITEQRFVLFGEGEACPHGTHGGVVVQRSPHVEPELEGPCELCRGHGYLPPAWMVEAAKPCENWGHDVPDDPSDPCPDYSNGQRRHPVTVPCDGIIGSRWRINDTGGTFTVRTVAGQYAYVANERGTERRILAHRIRSSRAKTGYTRIDDGRITVAHAVVEWGPTRIVRDHEMLSGDFLFVGGDNRLHGLIDNREIHTGTLPPDVDPASLVGQWAIGGRIKVAS